MASRRYDNRFVFVNESSVYSDQFKNRNIRKINQFATPEFKSIEASDIMSLTTRTHVWKMGDKFYKLAFNAYGSPRLWWIIPWFNQKPLESDFAPGDTVEIPFPLSSVLDLFYKPID